MEEPEEQVGSETPEEMGEDHRQGPPGYDLDEQEAIEELERQRDAGES